MREAGLGRAGEGRNCVRLSEARDKASVLFRQVKSGIAPLAVRDAALASAKAAAQDAAVRLMSLRGRAASRPGKTRASRPSDIRASDIS
jgi:hypothetical protein